MRVLLGIVAALALPATTAHAQDYTLDLYTGAAVGSVRIVGMGGAVLATAEGTSGTLSNPAAAAVRLTTSQGSWDWDWHLDYLSERASDFDNNGEPDAQPDSIGPSILTYGLGGMYRGWGLAVVAIEGSTRVGELDARATQAKVAVAREFLDQRYTIGVALRIGTFDLQRDGVPLFAVNGAGVEAGVLWRKPKDDWRVGGSITLPIYGDDVQIACGAACPDPLPTAVGVPWQVAVGVAWRWAPTRWNQRMPVKYRDEPAVLLAGDLVFVGPVEDGYGLQGFSDGMPQASGRSSSLSLRGGAEYEWKPGRLRLRGGSYWEPGRIEDVGGRLHGTFGIEGAYWTWAIRGWTFRPRLSLTADVAARYVNTGVSVGFWH